jgi:hypothetical protein
MPKAVFSEQDFEHFCSSVDHVVLFSAEEFWPWNHVGIVELPQYVGYITTS